MKNTELKILSGFLTIVLVAGLIGYSKHKTDQCVEFELEHGERGDRLQIYADMYKISDEIFDFKDPYHMGGSRKYVLVQSLCTQGNDSLVDVQIILNQNVDTTFQINTRKIRLCLVEYSTDKIFIRLVNRVGGSRMGPIDTYGIPSYYF